MALKHVIVHVDGSARARERIDLALSLGREHGARLTGLFAENVSLGSSIVGRRSPDAIQASMQAAQATFAAKAATAGLASVWWALEARGDVGRLAGDVAICCRYADMAVFGQHEGEGARLPEEVLESVVLESGRPVLIVPEVGRYASVGKRVVIAWTGSRESARAVNDALPLMTGAELVAILAFQQQREGASTFPKLDIVAHLESHGIQARYERVVVGEEDDIGVRDSVLNRTSDLSADLIVMGARAAHAFGVARLASHARAFLRSMTTPVLLSA